MCDLSTSCGAWGRKADLSSVTHVHKFYPGGCEKPAAQENSTITTSLGPSNCTLEHSQMASQWGVGCPSGVFNHLSAQLKRELKDIMGICNVPCKVSDP